MNSRRTTLHAVLLLATALITALTSTPLAAQSGTSTSEASEPAFETFGALPWEEPPGAMSFIVWEVNDGDTIRVIDPMDVDDPDPWWEPVRIIGIDTPEKDGPYTDAECFGEEATAFISTLLPRGTTIYLQADNDPDIDDDRELTADGMEFDDNDRWLMHVYLRDGDTDDYYLLSEIITLGGFADVPGYQGNTYFERELDEALEIARDEQRGMWGACT